MPNRIIAHLDMDAFYAAIEERDNPQFAGKPIVVGADPKKGRGRGVVSTANYKARKFGIGSAMPISQAYRLAPEAVFLPPDIAKYQRVSERIAEILRSEVQSSLRSNSLSHSRSKVPALEKASTDEFYLDLSHLILVREQGCERSERLKSYEKARQLVFELKGKIRQKEELTASAGIGPNKLVAKIASSKNKPDGLTVVKPNQVLDFLAPLDIQEIPGIGPKTAQRFHTKKIKTIGELRRLNKEALSELAGSFGDTLFDLAHGKDERPVGEVQPVKSVGKQITFEKDTADPKLITDTLLGLAHEVWKETAAKRLKFKTVTVIARYENFETHTKAETQKRELQEFSRLKKIVLKLLLPFLNRRRKVRLVGIRLSNPI